MHKYERAKNHSPLSYFDGNHPLYVLGVLVSFTNINNITFKTMQKKQGSGNITALEIPTLLAEYNTTNNVTRARLVFSFVGTSSNDENDLTAQLLSRVGNNSYSLIIDISDLGLQKATALFVGKQATFTVFSFSISELTDGKYLLVNNGEREYSSLSSPHIGENNDDKTAFENLVKRLKKDILDGKLFLGKMPQGNTPPQKNKQRPLQQPPTQNTPPTPPQQGGDPF